MKVWLEGHKHKRQVDQFRAEISAIKLSKEALTLAGRAMAGGIIDNIQKQQTWKGGALESNAPSTSERKRKKGRPEKSLIDKMRRFVRGRSVSWAIDVDPGSNNVTVSPATSEAAQISGWVQEMGYVDWIGISRATLAALKELIAEEIQKAVDRAAKRLNRQNRL